MIESLQPVLKSLPPRPGVYIMRDKGGLYADLYETQFRPQPE